MEDEEVKKIILSKISTQLLPAIRLSVKNFSVTFKNKGFYIVHSDKLIFYKVGKTLFSESDFCLSTGDKGKWLESFFLVNGYHPKIRKFYNFYWNEIFPGEPYFNLKKLPEKIKSKIKVNALCYVSHYVDITNYKLLIKTDWEAGWKKLRKDLTRKNMIFSLSSFVDLRKRIESVILKRF